ncbi:transglycosylase SLT domain-containing protein [Fundidesulfovibrio butyratiphilus]
MHIIFSSPGVFSSFVTDMAPGYRIPPEIALALVHVESGGCYDAWNPEPRYNYLWDVRENRPFKRLTPAELASKYPPKGFPAPPGVDPDAEYWGQQASWGLGQIMGANARALGYNGKFLTGLCEPGVGLSYALQHLSRLRDQFLASTGWPGVLAAYNAGSPRKTPDGTWENQAYVDKIALALGGAWPS